MSKLTDVLIILCKRCSGLGLSDDYKGKCPLCNGNGVKCDIKIIRNSPYNYLILH